MKHHLNLTWEDLDIRAYNITQRMKKAGGTILLYGIPRGGIYAAQVLSTALWRVRFPNRLVNTPLEADIFIDDIVDSGTTRETHLNKYTDVLEEKIPFYALVDFTGKDKSLKGTWISFPWERMTNDDGPVENIRRIIEYIGDNPDREGLKETPGRVIKSYKKLFGGYKQKPTDVIKIFDDSCDEMVLVKDIEFYSTCEHHMLPFFGKAHIAYIPNGKVIGISKLIRILEIYARRLQIQERMCQQITKCLQDLLNPLGVACVLEAQHFCMTARGVEKQHSKMITSSLTGVFKNKGEARNEFMSMIG